MGFSAAETVSFLGFSSGGRAEFRQRNVAVTLARLNPSGWTWRATLAALTGGQLRQRDADFDLAGGGGASLSVVRSARFDSWPAMLWSLSGAVTLSGALGDPSKDAQRSRYLAFDARGAATIAYQATSWLVPYLSGRVFGGPVLWRPTGSNSLQVGGDRYHVVAAVGVSLRTPTGLLVSLDYAPGA
ncbi:MAG TPA: hypothetical protein DCQ06_07115, partial [Myxococcales bacterium]|nr:hypothetical protein [Myxococcales bacterium]